MKTDGIIYAEPGATQFGPARDGGVWVREEKCATCIFHPGNRMHLREGTVARMKRQADECESILPRCIENISRDWIVTLDGLRYDKFSPSTSIADAWRVVDRMREMGWWVRVTIDGDGVKVEFFHNREAWYSIWRIERPTEVAAAICRAALAALEAKGAS